MSPIPQSCLFAPGDSVRKLEKALQSASGTVILDLEDGVAEADKAAARLNIAEALKTPLPEKRVLIRCNAPDSPHYADDLAWLCSIQADGIMLPKSEHPEQVQALAQAIPNVEIVPLIETALGVLNFEAIAASHPRVRQAAFGSVDFALDLGVEWTPEGEERRYVMGRLVLVSRALRLEPPIDAVYPRLDDQAAFEADARLGRALGFGSKMVIHPRQADWLRAVYNVSDTEADWCRRAVAAYENAGAAGSLKLDGKLIDLPVYKRAKQVLASL